MTANNNPQALSRPMLIRLAETDREPVSFELDGRVVHALKGDTLLTAILTNQGTLRETETLSAPRAGFCMMGACQDCWVTLTSGERVRACSTFITPGLCVTTMLGHRR
jgi:aerobic-type carbon monoxide dehydrogenase small subunit (CoxS/CutS family)